MLGSGIQDDTIFSGHAFQDMASKRPYADRQGFDLVGCFAPLLDAQMSHHRVDSEIHASRVSELLDIEKRIKSNQ